MVACPVLLEFNSFHIQQIVNNCNVIFTVKNVSEVVEIWRDKYAIAVIKILHNIFGDIDLSTDLQSHEDESVDEHYSMNSDWGQLRDDSSLNLLIDTGSGEFWFSYLNFQKDTMILRVLIKRLKTQVTITSFINLSTINEVLGKRNYHVIP